MIYYHLVFFLYPIPSKDHEQCINTLARIQKDGFLKEERVED